MLLVIQSMVWDQSKLPEDQESKSKPQASFQENLSMNLCKPVLRPSMVLSQSEEDKDSWLLVIDKQERLLLLLIQSLIKKLTSIQEMFINNFSAFMLLSDKRDRQLLTFVKFSRIMMLFDIPSSLLLLLQKPHHFNF